MPLHRKPVPFIVYCGLFCLTFNCGPARAAGQPSESVPAPKPTNILQFSHTRPTPVDKEAAAAADAGDSAIAAGDYPAAESMFRQALGGLDARKEKGIRAALLGNLVMAIRLQGRVGQNVPLAQEALRIYDSLLGADSLMSAASAHILALEFFDAKKMPEAENAERRALSGLEQNMGHDDGLTVDSARMLGTILFYEKKYNDAVPHIERATDYAIENADTKNYYGPDGAATADIVYRMAFMLYYTDDTTLKDRAHGVQLFKKALVLLDRVALPKDKRLGSTLNALAEFAINTRDFEAGDRYATRALAENETSLGAQPDTVVSARYLARALMNEGKRGEADDVFARAIALAEKSGDPLELGLALSERGTLSQFMGEPEQSEALLRQAVPLLVRQLGDRDLRYMAALSVLAEALAEQQKIQEAHEDGDHAVKLAEEAFGKHDARVVWPWINFAYVLKLSHQWDDSERYYGQAYSLLKELNMTSELEYGYATAGLGLARFMRGADLEAEPLLLEAAPQLGDTIGQTPLLGDVMCALAEIAHARGDRVGAENYAKMTVDIFQAIHSNSFNALRSAVLLGNIYLNEGNAAEAEKVLVSARPLFRARAVPVKYRVALERSCSVALRVQHKDAQAAEVDKYVAKLCSPRGPTVDVACEGPVDAGIQ